MAVRTFNAVERNCPANQDTVSPDVPTNGRVDDIQIRLTSTEWVAKAGTGSLTWGVERSDDGGANWARWITAVSPIGAESKDGGLPIIGVGRSEMVGALGARLRMVVRPTVAIRIGVAVRLEG